MLLFFGVSSAFTQQGVDSTLDKMSSSSSSSSRSSSPNRSFAEIAAGADLGDRSKVTPQHVIDKFWGKFTTKNPGKGMSLCPHKYLEQQTDTLQLLPSSPPTPTSRLLPREATESPPAPQMLLTKRLRPRAVPRLKSCLLYTSPSPRD